MSEESLRKSVEKLTIANELKAAISKHGARSTKAIESAIMAQVETTWLDDKCTVRIRDESGRYSTIDDAVGQLKKDPDWAPVFTPAETSGSQRQIDIADQSALNSNLAEIANGTAKVVNPREEKAALGGNEIHADDVARGQGKDLDLIGKISRGDMTVRTGTR